MQPGLPGAAPISKVGGHRTWRVRLLSAVMKRNSKNQSVLFALSSFVAVLVFWMAFAPVQLGGWVSYVIVDGNSMQPGFTFGDLVLVRRASDYGVGDAVVYRDANMDDFIFHRIVGMELDRFVLKGDNNSWLDSYRPTREEMIGKLWIFLPKLGKAVEWVRIPLHAAWIAGLMGGLLMLDFLRKPAQQKKVEPPRPKTDSAAQSPLFVSAAVALCFFALGIFAFIVPANKPAGGISYQQTGNYFYSATGTPGVYDTDVVHSGEPVFPKLTCFLNVGFNYELLGDLQNVAGTYKMTARIMDEQSGWQRTIPITSESPFTGGSFFTLGAVDLCQVESLVNLVEAEAGLKQISYTLEIVTDISLTATANGLSAADVFSPALRFQYDKVHFYLDVNDPQTDPLLSSKSGLAGSSTSETNTLSMLGIAVPVWGIRLIAVVGFLLSGAIFFALGWQIYNAASHSEEMRIRWKHGALVVDVYDQGFTPSVPLIDLATFDDLARLAERHGTMILHITRNFLHFYFVQAGGATYRYVVSAGKKGVAATELDLFEAQPAAEKVDAPVENLPPSQKPDAEYEKLLLVGERTLYIYPPLGEWVPEEERSDEPVISAADEVEYVIDTGEIEFVAPPPDSVFLRKIKI